MEKHMLQTPYSPRRLAFPSTQKSKGLGKPSRWLSFFRLGVLSLLLYLKISMWLASNDILPSTICWNSLRHCKIIWGFLQLSLERNHKESPLRAHRALLHEQGQWHSWVCQIEHIVYILYVHVCFFSYGRPFQAVWPITNRMWSKMPHSPLYHTNKMTYFWILKANMYWCQHFICRKTDFPLIGNQGLLELQVTLPI